MIYIDRDYKCYIEDDGTRRAVETDFFNGKCPEYIEGFRFIPDGESWTREDGEIFQVGMITPWKDYEMLCKFQKQYEALTAQNEALVNDMAQLVEEVYQSDLEMMTE